MNSAVYNGNQQSARQTWFCF